MLHHHCRRNPELQEELQIQAAVAAGDVHTVRKMLEQGYSPNGRDANGWTLLHFSAARGKERCVRVFLEHGADPTVKDLIGGFTALHYAAMHGRARIARLMLESDYRVDIINAKSNDGWTPLHVAAHYGRDSFVRLLLEFKAEVDPLSDKGQPRNLQDLCRIKIRQCIGLQNLKLLDELPIAKVMKDYLKHKFDDI